MTDVSVGCAAGLRDGVEVPKEESQLLVDIVSTVFPGATEDMVMQAITTRAERKDAYVVVY